MIGLALSLICNGQGANVFFSSHSAGCRPAGLTTYGLYDSLSIDGGAWYKGATLAEAKEGRMEHYNTYVVSESFHGKSFDASSLAVGQVTYQNYPVGSCYSIHDGWYYYVDGSQPYPIYEISGGSIASVDNTTSATGEGYLYNWWAAIGCTDGDEVSEEDLAPDGWRIADTADFTTLYNYLRDNGFAYSGTGYYDFAYSIAATTGWTAYGGYGGAPGYDQGTNNATGFNLKSYGFREYTGTYQSALIGIQASFWNSVNIASSYGGNMVITNSSRSIPLGSGTYKGAGYHVRLIKNTSNNRNYLIDYDGNHYATVQIGNQTWLAANYKCTHYRDGTAIPHVVGTSAWAALTSGAYCIYNEPTE